MNINQFSFYNSVLDFFSVLLPGFVLTLVYFTTYWTNLTEAFMVEGKFQTFYFNLVFLLLSYVIGQVLFQLGSYIDKLSYDKFNTFIYNEDYNLSVIKEYREKQFQNFDRDLLPKGRDQFEHHLNNFQWSLSYLRKNDNAAYAEVEKIIADSKFFRSILAATLLYIIYYALIHVGFLLLPLTVLSLVVYGYYFYKDDNCEKLTVDERKVLGQEEIKFENNKRTTKRRKLRQTWYKRGRRLYVLCLGLFIIYGLFIDCAHWCEYVSSESFKEMCEHIYKMELTGYYNVIIGLVSLISLKLYFRIRKKSIKKTYEQVVYNLKLTVDWLVL